MIYSPNPIPTDSVKLSDDLLELSELLAKNSHEVWAKMRMDEGWSFGVERNDEKMEHPCLVPYEELPESEKNYDRGISTEILKLIVSLGYEIKKPITTNP